MPELATVPCRVVVLVEQDVSAEWQDDVSDWIVGFGCRYMMAWGQNCSSWDDSVDWALLRNHDFSDVPDDRFVMTTWHDQETLSEAFEFCIVCAHHPTIDLPTVRIIDITEVERGAEISSRYQQAQEGLAG